MTAPNFIDQLRITVATMQAAHPVKADAISRAHAAIVEGHVVDLGDGFGKVLSRNGSTWYTCNGTCDCTAATYGKSCRHLAAWKLYQHVQKQRDAQPLPPAPVPTAAPVAATVPPAPLDGSWCPPGPGQALPEAPASVNCHIMLEGRQLQITLRDTDETRLLERLAAVLHKYPVLPSGNAKEAIKSSGEISDTGQRDWCQIHHVTMHWNEGKDGRKGWHSHKTPEGQWCQGRVRR